MRHQIHSHCVVESLETRTLWSTASLPWGPGISADASHAEVVEATLHPKSPAFPIYQTIDIAGQDFSVGIVRADGSDRPIRTDRQMWIVSHGWQSSPASMQRLANAMALESPKRQILLLDWSTVAADDNVVTVALRVPSVADWLVQQLTSWNIAGTKINLAGHSLGAYVAGDVANDIDSGVNRIIALDPATSDLPGLSISGVDYARDSRYSISFIGSDYSTPTAAFTADETIHLNVGPADQIQSHSNVHDLFASMTRRNSVHRADAISSLFSLGSLKPGLRPAWLVNSIDEGYEATLAGRINPNNHWMPQSLVYHDANTDEDVTITA